MAYESVRARLVQVLLDFLGDSHRVQESGIVWIDIPLSLRDLAAMIGASRQRTCEELQWLRRKGLIEVKWLKGFLVNVELLYQLKG